MANYWFLPALVAGLTVSLLFPSFVLAATFWIQPRVVIAIALFLMAWTMPSRSLWEEVRRPQAVLLAVAMSYGAAPLLAWLLSPLAPAEVRLGILISASVPCTLASAVLWTRLAGGNEATALLVTLSTTFTGWLITPCWLQLTTGTLVSLRVGDMMLDLLITLVLPVSLGQLAQAAPSLARLAKQHKGFWGVVAQLFILVIILQTSAKLGERAQGGEVSLDALEVGGTILLVVGLHLAILAAGLLAGSWMKLDRPRQLAVAFAGSQKTLPVAILLYEVYFRVEYPLAILPVLIYHVGQLLVDTPIAVWLRAVSGKSSPILFTAENAEGAEKTTE